ncbi:MAG: DinB family protein [Acidobacteriota bacterium]|nr:DinB family protein [Acidobacteriota bacterium]
MNREASAPFLTQPAAPLILQLRFNGFALAANLEGLSHREGLVQPAGGGNCLNWVVGHLLVSRNRMLELVEQPEIWDSATRQPYVRGSAAITDDGDGVLSLEQLLADFQSSQATLLEALGAQTRDELASPAVGVNGRETDRLSALAELVFHEAYHVGQTGLLRRIAGHDAALS